ncbi:MAG TPA: FxLYD domain-containing protein [Candidatus Limnocylindrales bacterium]|nr:FxLYD domain-containing protein [Candidatus Limnocylindrales bacterium]
MDPEPIPQRDDRSRFPASFIAGLIVVFIVAAAAVVVSRYSHSRDVAVATAKLPFGPEEQAYAPSIHFDNPQMARAKNLLNQEFIYVAGTLSNTGNRSIAALTVTMEFHDPFKQVILRDTEQLVTRKNSPVPPGGTRDFQITLEHIPAEWNQAYPSFRIIGLVLQ